jgi:hypothetical protein
MKLPAEIRERAERLAALLAGSILATYLLNLVAAGYVHYVA